MQNGLKQCYATILCYEIEKWVFFVQATNQVISYCPEATEEEKLAAVAAAEKAFETWQDSSILTRQQIMFGLQQKIKDNMVTSFI